MSAYIAMTFTIVYIGSWLAIAMAIWMVFVKPSNLLKVERKLAMTQWLINAKVNSTFVRWPAMFSETFNAVFTRRHFSGACFWRSCLYSVFAVAMISLFVEAFDIGLGAWATRANLHHRHHLSGSTFIAILVATACMSVIPSYVALLFTRVTVAYMQKFAIAPVVLVLLFLDIVAKSIIFPIWFLLSSTLLVCVMAPAKLMMELSEVGVFGLVKSLFDFSVHEPVVLIFFYSTFLTSVWIWLFGLSGFVVRILTKSTFMLNLMKKYGAIETSPLRVMGLVLMILVTVVYFVYGIYLLYMEGILGAVI